MYAFRYKVHLVSKLEINISVPKSFGLGHVTARNQGVGACISCWSVKCLKDSRELSHKNLLNTNRTSLSESSSKPMLLIMCFSRNSNLAFFKKRQCSKHKIASILYQKSFKKKVTLIVKPFRKLKVLYKCKIIKDPLSSSKVLKQKTQGVL